jgi:hypothetical protein
MNSEFFLILDILILAFSSIVSLFLVVKSNRNWLLFLAIPIIVICGINAYGNVNSLLGLSRPDYLPKEEVMVLQIAVEGKKYIHIWYVDGDESQPRAIKIKYSEELKKKMEGIGLKIRSGQNVFAGMKSVQGPLGPKTEIVEYEFSTKFQSKKTP